MNNFLKIIVRALLPFLVAHVLIGVTHGQLTAKDASEGLCMSQSKLIPHLHKGVNLAAFMIPRDYYIPMASDALYREYAEGLLGRPAATQEELDGMQVVLRSGSAFTTILNMGFPYMKQPPTFGQTCVPVFLPSFGNLGYLKGKVNLDYAQTNCIGLPATRPNGTMALKASQSFTYTLDSIIWMNPDETALLIYRCPSNGIKDYKVVSKTKTLNASDIEVIKEKVFALGFQEEHIAFMKYD